MNPVTNPDHSALEALRLCRDALYRELAAWIDGTAIFVDGRPLAIRFTGDEREETARMLRALRMAEAVVGPARPDWPGWLGEVIDTWPDWSEESVA